MPLSLHPTEFMSGIEFDLKLKGQRSLTAAAKDPTHLLNVETMEVVNCISGR
jgi:hypothetical protein